MLSHTTLPLIFYSDTVGSEEPVNERPVLAIAKALVLILIASLYILWEHYENLKGFTHFLSLVRVPLNVLFTNNIKRVYFLKASTKWSELSSNTIPSVTALGKLTVGISIIDGLGIEVWKVTASLSDLPSREPGESSGVSIGWLAVWLLEFRFALPFFSEQMPESCLSSGVLSSPFEWLGCLPALAMGWT